MQHTAQHKTRLNTKHNSRLNTLQGKTLDYPHCTKQYQVHSIKLRNFSLGEQIIDYNIFSEVPVLGSGKLKKLHLETWFCPTQLYVLWLIFDHIGLIWTGSDHSFFNQSTWTCLFGPDCYDLSTWIHQFRHIYLDLSLWTHLFEPIYFDPSIWTRLFRPAYFNLFLGPVYLIPFI